MNVCFSCMSVCLGIEHALGDAPEHKGGKRSTKSTQSVVRFLPCDLPRGMYLACLDALDAVASEGSVL